ncbi:hypothetical protein GMMP13_90003 [Candidatus Magnetomoraceae bacterium gMMP-13]
MPPRIGIAYGANSNFPPRLSLSAVCSGENPEGSYIKKGRVMTLKDNRVIAIKIHAVLAELPIANPDSNKGRIRTKLSRDDRPIPSNTAHTAECQNDARHLDDSKRKKENVKTYRALAI